MDRAAGLKVEGEGVAPRIAWAVPAVDHRCAALQGVRERRDQSRSRCFQKVFRTSWSTILAKPSKFFISHSKLQKYTARKERAASRAKKNMGDDLTDAEFPLLVLQ